MNPGLPDRAVCQLAREGLLDFVDPSGPTRAMPQAFHCDACRAWFERAGSQARAIHSLPRRVADMAPLDGLVVAELNAGRRQERAGAALAALQRLQVPSELDALVKDQLGRARRGAPAELEGRVALELQAGAGPRIERQLGRLARLSAPAELDLRVAGSLADSPRSDGVPMRRWIAIAATLFVVFGAATLVRQLRHEPYTFRVVHTSSTASLDPLALGQLSAVSGVWFGGAQ
ncbi:MAG TPA: hypothetical protein VK843_07895 [Planctomycetota bacterium]|nr:hypothetical protein [Planctomycetota bacterium]